MVKGVGPSMKLLGPSPGSACMILFKLRGHSVPLLPPLQNGYLNAIY